MELTVTGKIKVIEAMQTFDSGFTKRTFVVTTEEQYPQDIAMDLFKDKCSILDKYKVGQRVTAAFNIRGSEYNGKHYVNLNAWKINPVEGNTQSTPPPVAASGKDDDLPF